MKTSQQPSPVEGERETLQAAGAECYKYILYCNEWESGFNTKTACIQYTFLTPFYEVHLLYEFLKLFKNWAKDPVLLYRVFDQISSKMATGNSPFL